MTFEWPSCLWMMHFWISKPGIICWFTSLRRIDWTIFLSFRLYLRSLHSCTSSFLSWFSRDVPLCILSKLFLMGDESCSYFVILPASYSLCGDIGLTLATGIEGLAWIRWRIHSISSGLSPSLPQRWRHRSAWALLNNPPKNCIAGSISPHLSRLRWVKKTLYLMKSLKHVTTSSLKGVNGI